MNKLKKVLSAVVDVSNRPAETWRFLRQSVREVHVVLQGVTALVAELEERLDRLEAAATRRPTAASADAPARTRRRHAAPNTTTKKRASNKPRARRVGTTRS